MQSMLQRVHHIHKASWDGEVVVFVILSSLPLLHLGSTCEQKNNGNFKMCPPVRSDEDSSSSNSS